MMLKFHILIILQVLVSFYFSEYKGFKLIRKNYQLSLFKPNVNSKNKLYYLTNSNENDSDNQSKYTLISTLSFAGVIESSYLTWSKITSSDISGLCQSGNSCNNVLSSPYSEIPLLNIPLSLIAIIGYGLVFMSSLNPNNLTKNTMVLLSTSLATFSGYLMILLQTVIHLSCSYCYISAFLSFSLFLIIFNSNIIANKSKLYVLSSVSTLITIFFSTFLYYATGVIVNNNVVSASTAPAGQYIESIEEKKLNKPPSITTKSSEKAVELANKLKKLDAKMYGAFWCSHCYNQKQILGKEASETIGYIECDKQGYNTQNSLCKDKKVPGYPTWEINNELYPGEKTLDELNDLLNQIEKSKVIASK